MTAFSPYITTDRLPDHGDLTRFGQFPAWRDLPAAEKAIAMFRYMANRETGLYPVQGIYEDPDPGPAYSFYDERDLVKAMNVHGHGYCGLLSHILDGAYAHAGFEDSRIQGMDANHHTVTEVFYDGAWHYFDLDLRGMLIRDDGSVADLKDACAVRSLWTDPPAGVTPFYPGDYEKEKMFEGFAACKTTPEYRWYKNGHTMDVALRPGESLTRWWQPQGSRWFHPWPNPGGFDLEFLTRRFNEPPRGIKCKHRDWSVWAQGNALFSYTPNLSSDSDDFEAGAYDFEGVETSPDGLMSSEGFATFEVRTPYIIVGEVKEMGPPAEIEGAAQLSYRSLGPVVVNVSTDNGLTWQVADRARTAESRAVDLTPHVLHTYGYLLRFDFGPESGLAKLDLHTWGQLAPVSLPRLFEGENRLSFNLGDRHGHSTTSKEIRLNLRDPAQLERHLVRLDGSYEPLRHLSKIEGEAVIKVNAKPRTQIRWLTAGGYFNTHHGPDADKNRNAIEWSTSGPEGPWTRLDAPDVPDWVRHWHYGIDGDIVLDDPAETVYLKYTGDPGLNQIWVYAHCEPLSANRVTPVHITHGFTIDGEITEVSHTFAEPTEYTITCPSQPENCFLRLSVDTTAR